MVGQHHEGAVKKREQNLQDVPMAVSAFSGSTLQNAGVGDIEDLARQVPALQVQSNTSTVTTNYRMRRVGNLGSIPTFEPAVGVFVDGYVVVGPSRARRVELARPRPSCLAPQPGAPLKTCLTASALLLVAVATRSCGHGIPKAREASAR